MAVTTITLEAKTPFIVKDITQGQIYVKDANGELTLLAVGDTIQVGDSFEYNSEAQFVLTSGSESLTADTIASSNMVTKEISSAPETEEKVLLSDGDTYTVHIDRDGNEVRPTAGFDSQIGASDGSAQASFIDNLIVDGNNDPDDTATNAFHSGLYPNTGLTFNTVSQDGTININESESDVTVSGTALYEANEGDNVKFSAIINDKEVDLGSTTIDANKEFTIDFAGNDLVSVKDFTIKATITTYSSEGLYTTISEDLAFDIDLTRPEPTIALNSITNDNIVSIEEHNNNIEISGIVGGDAKVGDKVTVTVNEQSYSATVDTDYTFTVSVDGKEVAEDTSITATVLSYDKAGNSSDGVPSSTTTKTYEVDLTAPEPTITVNHITADNIVNAAEEGR
ncbi:Ig-like domain-containing protein, partial [uncultured Shewanella sp.]|uniref:Ig-like domain-containing protein n=1 Tax=uncultured Shewanella sp. TaxID=173975 RepID=UPI00263A1038